MSKNYNTFIFIGTENENRNSSSQGVPCDGGVGAAGEQCRAAAIARNDLEEALPSGESRRHPSVAPTTEEEPCERSPFPDGDDDDATTTPNPIFWNLSFCVLAWACTVACLTLVVGTSNVVLLSIGGDPNLSSVPFAAFFLGASLVSLLVTPRLFRRRGRKAGFQCGVAFGLSGSWIGALSILYRSSVSLIIATALFGAAVGIGFHLRFAALEVVPEAWAERAVTLVVAGGCIAAFLGPESAEVMRGVFGDECEFLGVFVMTGLFNLANMVFTSLVHFPPKSNNLQQDLWTSGDKKGFWQRIRPIVTKRHFIVPVLISTGSWIIMALPMSVLRVAMHQVGFTSRQSLVAIEMHFLGMYAPGFFSGKWIARYGPRWVSMVACPIFVVAFACLQTAKGAEESSGIILWILGMVVIGVGWNCSFSASTVGLTRSYSKYPDCKSLIQAANDGLTFLLAGALICCASFIYRAGGEGLEGWWTINWVVLDLIVLFSLILVSDVVLEQSETDTSYFEKWSAPSKAFAFQAES